MANLRLRQSPTHTAHTCDVVGDPAMVLAVTRCYLGEKATASNSGG